MAIVNLLKETEKALLNHQLHMRNVRCIRNAEGYITIADFVTQADKINYDNGFGTIEIDPTLKIIGSFWWLTRENYDGMEGWVFHKKPKKPALQAHDFLLKNTRVYSKSSFEESIEK